MSGNKKHRHLGSVAPNALRQTTTACARHYYIADDEVDGTSTAPILDTDVSAGTRNDRMPRYKVS